MPALWAEEIPLNSKIFIYIFKPFWLVVYVCKCICVFNILLKKDTPVHTTLYIHID